MKNRRRILIDVDGVLGDFCASALTLIHEKTGVLYTRDDITEWDVFETLGIKDQAHILDDAVNAGGFCSGIKAVEGAKEAVQQIENSLGNVYAVTSPYHASPWMGERSAWLVDQMGISRKRQVHTKAKHLIAGDVLIDDGPKNLEAWAPHWSTGLAMLMDQPWNQEEKRFHRVRDWEDVLVSIDMHLKRTVKAFA